MAVLVDQDTEVATRGFTSAGSTFRSEHTAAGVKPGKG